MIILQPKKFSELDLVDDLDGQEYIPIVKEGENKIVKVEDLPASAAGVQSIVAGENITVDDTDPQNPIVSAESSGGGAVDSVNDQVGVVVLDQDDIEDGIVYKQYSDTEKTKLAGIEAGAEVNNISDANATDLTDAGDSGLHYHSSDRDRANHTGSQAISTVTDLQSSLDAKLDDSQLDTDGTLSANSDSKIPSQKAVKTYADQIIASADAMVFKGVVDASANPNYPAADKGWTYRISVAGKIGGASGVTVEIGDLILCLVDGSPAGNQATVGANWSVAQTNVDGAVIGPASVTDDLPAIFDGVTGKLIKSKTYAAFKTLLALVKGDVGLGNVDNTADASKNVATAAQLTTPRNIDGQAFSGAADITVIAPGTHAATSKTTPVDADELSLVDSAASNVLKKLTWANLKATLKTYFDTIYQAALGYTAENVANKDTDGTLAANSDTKYASQKAAKTYADTKIAKSFIDAKGDLIAGSANDTPAILPVGSDGQVLTADAASTPGVKWSTPSSGGGLGLIPTAVKTAAYNAAVNDLVLGDTNTTGAFTVTLPSAPADKSLVAVKHVLQGSTSNYPNVLTVARGGSDVFDKAGGATSVTIPLLNSLMIFQYQSSTGVWHQIADHRDLSNLDSRLLSATTIIPQSAFAGTGADMMTPLVSGNNATTYALAAGSVILALAIHSGQAVNVLEVHVSATALTAGQGITIGCYAYNADGTIGLLLWSQVITIGTSTAAIKVTGLSKVMPTGRCVIAVLNPSTNAGSVTLRAQSAQTGRGLPIDFQNGAFAHSLLTTGRSALDADLTAVKFRTAVATNELTPGPTSFPIIGAWT